jgi:probable HAF family extracellular repeat protein
MNSVALMSLCLSLSIILSVASPLQAAPRYYYQDLGVLEGGNQSEAYGINLAGQVVGVANLNPSTGRTHGFLKTPGQPMQDLGALEGGYDSEAYGINAAGQVVGAADANNYLRAFLKDPDQPMQDLGDLGGASRAWGINAAGHVVGRTDYESGTVSGVRAFLKKPGQPMENLGTLGGRWSEAVAINDTGQVAGTSLLANNYGRAYLKNPGEDMQNLGTLGGGSSEAHGLNNLGQVVGWAHNPDNYQRAFLKTPSQDMQDLGTLGGDYSWAYGINDAGQVVGWADDIAVHSKKAFLWEKGVMYNLNHLTVNLPGNGEWPGIYLETATAINNRGCIAGITGTYPPHAFLLTPVGSSAGIVMLLLD